MHIVDDKPKMIFKNVRDDKEYYSIGLSTKSKDGSYQNGYMSCRFRKDVSLENKTRIRLQDAWLDFYLKDKTTYTYIFINDFEIVDAVELPKNAKTEYDALDSNIQINDSDLPF